MVELSFRLPTILISWQQLKIRTGDKFIYPLKFVTPIEIKSGGTWHRVVVVSFAMCQNLSFTLRLYHATAGVWSQYGVCTEWRFGASGYPSQWHLGKSLKRYPKPSSVYRSAAKTMLCKGSPAGLRKSALFSISGYYAHFLPSPGLKN